MRSDDEPSESSLPADFFRLLIEQSGDGVIMSDEHGVLRIFNPEAERQHGVARQEIAAPAWGEAYGLYSLEGRKLPLTDTPLYRAVNGERVVDARWVVRLPSGEDRILSGTATPLRHPDGTPAGAVLITRDETERLAAERERGSLLERERLARTSAEALAAEVTQQMVVVEQALRDAHDRVAALEQQLSARDPDNHDRER